MKLPRVYLAGPDVFLPGAGDWLARKKAICAECGLAAVVPLDPVPEEPAPWAAVPGWRRIALRNEAHIRASDAVIANLTPFRGASADPGTVYEVGFMRALGRPVFGYATTAAPFTERTLDWLGLGSPPCPGSPGDATHRDTDGMAIEAFGLFDNLMIEGGIVASGGVLIVEELARKERWTDLSVFRRCAAAASCILGAGG